VLPQCLTRDVMHGRHRHGLSRRLDTNNTSTLNPSHVRTVISKMLFTYLPKTHGAGGGDHLFDVSRGLQLLWVVNVSSSSLRRLISIGSGSGGGSSTSYTHSCTKYLVLVQSNDAPRSPMRTGNLAAVNMLLNTAGVVDNINVLGYLGNTAISRAARHGHVDILHALLSQGNANMEICNNEQQYPLHFAAFKHKLEAVQVLLHHGASPLVLDLRKGRTPAEDTDDEEIRTIIRLAQHNYVEAGIQ